MAHTNSTTHYEYPQFIGTDKPGWLTDVNTAYSDIDGDIYEAKTKADDAYTLADTANGKADNAIQTANTANNSAGTANTNIGTMADLETTDKTSLVGAINEVRTKVYETKRVTLASGNYNRNQGNNIITLSEDFRNYDDIIIGGNLYTYVYGQTLLATDKIELGVEYDLFVARTGTLFMSISFRFNSYTEIEILSDNSQWGGNIGTIAYVEGQHL